MAGQGPGSPQYNVTSRAFWSFPDIYGKDYVITKGIAGYQSQSIDGNSKLPLGNIGGSPVVFNNTDDGTTRIYFAANTGQETVTEGTGTQNFPPSDSSGRIWAVKTDGSFGFAFPSAGDPNSATPGAASPPIGGFLHTTPAVGFVTYPASIYYVSAGGTPTAYSITDSKGHTNFDGTGTAAALTKPMLYAGTSGGAGVTGSALYYLNLDGTTDDQREISEVAAPNGSSFQSSPVLVANTSSAANGGNGGSVFITTADNHLVQYQATPITTANADAPFPSPRLDYTFPLGDAVSAPAVGAASVSDLTGTTVTDPVTGATTTVSESVTDWVYVGDYTTGLCFGVTPRGFGSDTTGNFIPTIIPPVPPAVNFPPVVSQFPLRAYIFDGTNNHPASATDLNKSDPFGQTSSALPVFEWGQTVYFRIANVVPPGTPISATDLLTNGDGGTVVDPTTPGAYLGNGGQITFQTTEMDSSGQNVPGTIDTFTVPAILTADPSAANGFFERADAGTTLAGFGITSELDASGNPRGPGTLLRDTNGKGYAAAVAYNVGWNGPLDVTGINRHNTPGPRRKLISVTQTVTHYAPSSTPAGHPSSRSSSCTWSRTPTTPISQVPRTPTAIMGRRTCTLTSRRSAS